MSKGVSASLGVAVAVFGLDLDPETVPSRALQVLTIRRELPHADVGSRESLAAAAIRAAAEAGVDLGGGTRGKVGSRLHIVGFDDSPARARTLTVWYYATAPYTDIAKPASWIPVGRSVRLDRPYGDALKTAYEKLRGDTRHLAGAVGLIGDVFTGDDLLCVHMALHGGPEGSERTFRRRVQELRDNGVLKPVRTSEVAALRLRVPRFRSQIGTGGRPPELLRYSGSGGEVEQLAALRARRLG